MRPLPSRQAFIPRSSRSASGTQRWRSPWTSTATRSQPSRRRRPRRSPTSCLAPRWGRARRTPVSRGESSTKRYRERLRKLGLPPATLRPAQNLFEPGQQPVVAPLQLGYASCELSVARCPGLPGTTLLPLTLRDHSMNSSSMSTEPSGVGRPESALGTYVSTASPRRSRLVSWHRCSSLCHLDSA